MKRGLTRRNVVKGGLAIGAAAVVSPPILSYGQGEQPIKVGLDDPFTGTYAELGKNEQIGAQLAVDQINAKGGILGRKVQLLSEDSTSADTGTAVQKAHKLIERDKVNFLLGNVNSAMTLAIGEISNQASSRLLEEVGTCTARGVCTPSAVSKLSPPRKNSS